MFIQIKVTAESEKHLKLVFGVPSKPLSMILNNSFRKRIFHYQEIFVCENGPKNLKRVYS